MIRVLLGFCVGVIRVLLESVLFEEVGVLGCSEGVCVEGWCWVVGYGGERKIKNYFNFGSICYLG